MNGRVSANPALRELGFAAADRVVVVHADDIGMCEATVDAFFDAAERGAISAGSAMVPCPWFPAVAARCRGRTDVDLGVHLTLTCEWDRYRWGPLSTRDPASGLLDAEGYFHRSQDPWPPDHPRLAAAAVAEMTAQVDRAQAAGLDLTHLDGHMFAMLHPALTAPYVELGLARGLPVLLTRQPQWVERLSAAALAGWEERGLPVFDHLREAPLSAPVADRPAWARRMFDELPTGLTYLITHPARDTPELRAIGADWPQRVADLETFGDPELASHLRRTGVEVIGWQPLRELLRARLGRGAVGSAEAAEAAEPLEPAGQAGAEAGPAGLAAQAVEPAVPTDAKARPAEAMSGPAGAAR